MFAFCPIIIISSTLTFSMAYKPQIETYDTFYTYNSPTLNQPMETMQTLGEKQNQKLIENIFVDRMKEELDD